MKDYTKPPKCCYCDCEAITTAVQVPVCQKHWEAYSEEAKSGASYRPMLRDLYEKRNERQRKQQQELSGHNNNNPFE